ncbi:MAG: hypothetical protein HUU16_19355 [Candidatus Omnitrophica bacterium]|nr:hypothetical protein [bacterium]NUN98324.1 hypothetical protein [Candidatus Omnitrophota bacterium]
MTHLKLEKALHEQLAHLPIGQQHKVLDFARSLASTQLKGMPGSSLLRFAGIIRSDDLQTMAQVIEDGCEQVISGEW